MSKVKRLTASYRCMPLPEAYVYEDDKRDLMYYDDHLDSIATLQRERDELKAIVDKLPRNKSGTLPTEEKGGFRRWVIHDGEAICGFVGFDKKFVVETWSNGVEIHTPYEWSYDTHEAAEAAKGGEG